MKKLSVAFLTLVLVSACGGGSGGSSSGGAGGGNSAPLITSSNAYSIAEGETSIGTVVATDADGDSLTFSISGGPDASTVSVGSTSGALSFNAATDFEAPADANGDNVYNVTVRVGDGAAFDARDLVITVTNVVEAPVITSPASYTIEENITAIGTVTVSDAEGTVEFSVSGDDANLVSITSSGALSFVTAPDFENPADAGADNTYNFVVSAANSGGTVTQATSVTITDVDEDFIPDDLFISEYAEGSSNNKYLEIYNGTGAEVSLAEYALPSVGNAPTTPGEYEFWNDGAAIFGDVTAIADGDVFVLCHPSADEAILAHCDATHQYLSNGDDGRMLVKGTETAYTIVDTLGDFNGDPGSGWDVCGVDNATKDHTLVKKDRKGGNADWDASRGTNASDCDWLVKDNEDWTDLGKHCLDAQAEVAITVNNTTGEVTVAENQTAVATVDASVTACKTLTYALSGADAALFAVSDAGVVTFVAAPDFEAPGDANADNIYNFTVTVSVGDLSETLDMVVTVSDVTGGNLAFTEAFGGAVIGEDGSFSFPTGAESWAGFANMNAELYPITISEKMKLTFTGAAPAGDVKVYFRFERLPFPDVDPAFNTAEVTVSGAEEKTYTVSLPAQGTNTFSSVIMYVVDRDVAVTVKDPKIEALNLVADFSGVFGGTTVTEDGVYTFPAGAEGWAGFANENSDLYPMTLEKGAAITFTGSAVDADVDVRFRFERLPFPDVDPSYNSTAVTVTGTTDAEYTICVPAQDAANTYSSFLMYLDTRDAGVKVSNVKVTAYEEAVTDCEALANQSEYTAAMTGTFGGFGYDAETSTYTFASGNESWAGVANEAADIYPLAFEKAGKITFKASVPDGGTQEVRFRFERLPFPDVDPAYDTAAVTVSGAEEATYEIAVPVQAGLTFSSFLMYLNTRDVPTIVKDVVVTADKKSTDDSGGGDSTNGGGTMSMIEAFGGATVSEGTYFVESNGVRVEGRRYEKPAGAESWAGFAHDPNMDNSSIYPIKFPNGGTITARMVGWGTDNVNVYFRFEKAAHPDVEPSYQTANIPLKRLSQSDSPVVTIDIPSQGDKTFGNFLMYIVEEGQRVLVESVVVTPKAE
jgi:hypothetical protein